MREAVWKLGWALRRDPHPTCSRLVALSPFYCHGRSHDLLLWLQLQMNGICSRARNAYSKEQLKRDFK